MSSEVPDCPTLDGESNLSPIGAIPWWILKAQGKAQRHQHIAKHTVDKPTLLKNPTAPWHELNFGSTAANSATTEATDARAA